MVKDRGDIIIIAINTASHSCNRMMLFALPEHRPVTSFDLYLLIICCGMAQRHRMSRADLPRLVRPAPWRYSCYCLDSSGPRRGDTLVIASTRPARAVEILLLLPRLVRSAPWRYCCYCACDGPKSFEYQTLILSLSVFVCVSFIN